MKIRTRITIVCTLIMLLSVGITIALAVHSITREGRKEADEIRTLELTRTKTFLRNFVEAGYSIIESDYKSTTNIDQLKKQYGPELKTASNTIENIIKRISAKPLTHNEVLTVLKEFNKINANQDIIIYLYKFPNGHIHLNNENAGISKERLEYYFKHGRKYSGRYFVLTESALPRISYLKFDTKNSLLIGAAFTAPKVINDAKTRCSNTLRQSLYNNGEGYIFIFDSDCISIVHPHMPHRETTDFSYEKDLSGRRVIAEMVNMCLKKDQGYINYHWPKPTEGRKMIPDKDKLSFVKLFKPWMWIIGSGTYIDDLNERTDQRKKAFMEQVNDLVSSALQNTLFIFLIMAVIAIEFSKTLSRPIEALTWNVDHLDMKNLPDRLLPLKGPQEIVRLGEIFNNMLGSLKDEMTKVAQEITARRLVESELNIARTIQTDISNRVFPAFPEGAEYDVHSLYYPAISGSGSFFDMYKIGTDKLAIVIGDSTGSGVPASLYSIIVRTILRTQPEMEDAGEAVTHLNRALASNQQNMTECLFMGIINLYSGHISYCNAGCSFPFIIRKLRKIEDLPTIHGEPAGTNSEISYSSDNIIMDPCDILILYSPGLIHTGDVENPGGSRSEIRKLLEDSLRFSQEETLSCIMNTVESNITVPPTKRDIQFTAFEYLGPN